MRERGKQKGCKDCEWGARYPTKFGEKWTPLFTLVTLYLLTTVILGGTVAEWLACWTQAQKGMSSNRSRDAVG